MHEQLQLATSANADDRPADAAYAVENGKHNFASSLASGLIDMLCSN